jgi:hypothetical protein
MDEDALVRVRNRMAFVDGLQPKMREVVHEYGMSIVKAFMDCGMTNPKQILHIIKTIREGSAEVGERNRSDDMKIEVQKRYARYLTGGGLLVVPKIPTPEMVACSINALSDAGVSNTHVDRERKHTIRLILANVAGHTEQFGKI